MLPLFVAFWLAQAASIAHATPAQILLLRHAEKPPRGPHLSDRGWERARALPQLFVRPEFREFGEPAALFAMAPDRSGEPSADGASVRAIETLQYASASLGLPIHTEYTKKNYAIMMRKILAEPAYDEKLVVICWEHDALSDLAAELEIEPVPHYPGAKFDRAWLATLHDDGGSDLVDLPERLLPGDDAE